MASKGSELPIEVVTTFFSTVAKCLPRSESVKALKACRLTCELWSQLAEPALFSAAKPITLAITDNQSLQYKSSNASLVKHCSILSFASKCASVLRSQSRARFADGQVKQPRTPLDWSIVACLILDCVNVVSVTFDCSSGLPSFASGDGEQASFMHVKGLILSKVSGASLSALAGLLASFVNISGVTASFHSNVTRDQVTALVMPKLSQVRMIGNAIDGNAPRHIFSLLYPPNTLRQIRHVSVNSLEGLLADQQLVNSLSPGLSSIAFMQRYTVAQGGFRQLNLSPLNRFASLKKIDLRFLSDIDVDLCNIISELPPSVVHVHFATDIIGVLSVEEDALETESTPPRLTDGEFRLIYVHVLDPETGKISTDWEMYDLITIECEESVYANLEPLGIALAAIEPSGKLWCRPGHPEEKKQLMEGLHTKYNYSYPNFLIATMPSDISRMPAELVLHTFSLFSKGAEWSEALKAGRLVCKNWAALLEPLLFNQACPVHRIEANTLPTLERCVDDRVISTYCREINFSGELVPPLPVLGRAAHATAAAFAPEHSDLIVQIISACNNSLKMVSLTCTSDFPKFTVPASFPNVNILVMRVKTTSHLVQLSSLTTTLASFPNIQHFVFAPDLPIKPDKASPIDLPHLKHARTAGDLSSAVDDDGIDPNYKHSLHLLLTQSTLKRLEYLYLDSLEPLLHDEVLMASLGNVQSLTFETRYESYHDPDQDPNPELELDLLQLNKIPSLRLLDLTSMCDVYITLDELLKNMPSKVISVSAKMSVEQILATDFARLHFPSPRTHGWPRYIMIKLINHNTRQPISDDQEFSAVAAECSDMIEALYASQVVLEMKGGCGQKRLPRKIMQLIVDFDSD